jgi:hypothetical protein
MAEQKGAYKVALTAATTTAGGDALNLLNPEGVDLIITRLILDITTPATGAATADAGVTTTGTTSDTLLDGVDVGSAAAVFDSADETDSGTNGKIGRRWGSAQYLTITPSATLAGLVGNAYIEYIRV